MTRHPLQEIPLVEGFWAFARPGSRSALMDTGQWDDVLQAVYDLGWTLFEIDNRGVIRAAYRKASVDPRGN
jgi:hypothetical protein